MYDLPCMAAAVRRPRISRVACAGKLVLVGCMLACVGQAPLSAQSSPRAAAVAYDASTHVFRMDAAQTSYVMGVNEHGELETLYWGKRLADSDHLGPATIAPRVAGLDSSESTTPRDYVGWGGALYVEPDLKVTYPDGNRDLVLKYVSHTIDGQQLHIVMKDISREVFVTLAYVMDAETGILRRSAEIENRTAAALTVEQAASATWNLPRGDGLSAAVSDGPMGGRVERAGAGGAARQDGAREPPRHDGPTEQPLVCD